MAKFFDGLPPVAGRNDFHPFVGESKIDYFLNRNRVVGNKQLSSGYQGWIL